MEADGTTTASPASSIGREGSVNSIRPFCPSLWMRMACPPSSALRAASNQSLKAAAAGVPAPCTHACCTAPLDSSFEEDLGSPTPGNAAGGVRSLAYMVPVASLQGIWSCAV